MLLTMPLLILAGTANFGCQTFPDAPRPPVIEFHVINTKIQGTKCSRSDLTSCPGSGFSQMNGWFAFSPGNYQEIQNYIDRLICIAEGGCVSAAEVVGYSPMASTREAAVADLKQIRTRLRQIKAKLKN